MILKNKILKFGVVKWQNIKDLQPEDAKPIYNYEHLKKSLISNGFSNPLFVWEDKNGDLWSVDGRTRREVLREIQNDIEVPEELPAIYLNAKDRQEAIKILLEVFNMRENPFDDKILQEWIKVEQVQVNIESINVKIENEEAEAEIIGEVQDDDFDPTPPENPKTVLGDLYEIGEHRLLCGDSTNIEDITKLMGGKLADMCHTDPPYNVDYDGGLNKKRDKIKNDKIKDFEKFLFDTYTNIATALKKGGVIYVWLATLEIHNFVQPYLKAGFLYKSLIIWNKSTPSLSRSDYQWKHEGCLYGWLDGAAHKWYGDIKQTTVWDFDRPSRSDAHPTMKPVPLCAKAIQNSSTIGDIVLDVFLGSGSTMLAAHQLKRKCYGIEISPKYCDTIIKRMINLDPNITIKRNGVKINNKDYE